MDFAENIPVMEEVAAKLNEAADRLEGHASDIKKGIEGLNEDWVGESYNNFKAQCDSFAPSMDALCDVLRAYALIFTGNVEPAGETLEAAVQSALG